MIVVVCPGQGSQTPGFLEPWLAVDGFRDRLQSISEEVGLDLLAHGTTSDADTIRDTAVAQPLIVAAGILTLEALLGEGRATKIGGIAGHSVGEITAAAGAGILSATDAVRFVRERGQSMAAAAALEPTSMAAVLKADEAELLSSLDTLGLEPANYNGAGQIVVAGAVAALAELKASPPAGARVMPLQVAGAFHTRYMRPAVAHMRAVADGLEPNDPSMRIWTNRDGSAVTSGSDFVDLLVGQLASPVRWDLCMESFTAAGVTGIIEVTPAGALAGLAKRGLPGIPTVAIKTPDDLQAARDLIDQA